MGIKRLKKEYISIIKNPIQNIETHPLESNIFIWHYVIKGFEDPYKNGFYHVSICCYIIY